MRRQASSSPPHCRTAQSLGPSCPCGDQGLGFRAWTLCCDVPALQPQNQEGRNMRARTATCISLHGRHHIAYAALPYLSII